MKNEIIMAFFKSYPRYPIPKIQNITTKGPRNPNFNKKSNDMRIEVNLAMLTIEIVS